jgi:hypothetical protein
MGDGCAEVRTREITAGVAEVYADSEVRFLGQVFLVAVHLCGAGLVGSFACSLPGGLNRWSVLTVVCFTEREYH